MPSGAKKRKAAKKKLQKEAHNTTHNNGVHSQQGNDDPKSHDERDSDGGEVNERECSWEPVMNNPEEGTKEIKVGKEYGEQLSSEVKLEAGIHIDEGRVDDVAREINGDSSGEHKSSSSSSSSSSDDDEVSVEKEKTVVEELGEASCENSVPSEAVQSSIKESIPIEESVKQVISLPQELNLATDSVSVENSAASDVIESGLNKQSVENTETKVVPVVDEGSRNPSESVDITAREEEALLPQSSDVPSGDKSFQDDHVDELEKHKHQEEQPLVSSAPLPVRRTSWMNCCGLFEVLSGGSSR